MEADRIPTKVAARIIGVVPQYLQQEMRAGRMPIGHVVGGGKRKNYIILRGLFENYIGRKLTDEEIAMIKEALKKKMKS